MRAGVPLALQQDLLTAGNLVSALAENDSAALQFGATRTLRTIVENRNGRIFVDATLTDIATQRDREIIRVEGPAAAGLLSPLNGLAQRLNAGATPYSTKSQPALQLFTAAAQTSNAPNRIDLLKRAIAVDPSFGLAYMVLAETLAQTGQDARPVLTQAAAHCNGFTPFDRARFNQLASRILHAPLVQQQQAATAVLKIAPNDLDAIAALGSDQFLQGDSRDGERLLDRALDLNPGNATLRQQLALGLIETRQFSAAEKILQAIDNNSSILPALAFCIYLEGDVSRADEVFHRYLALRPGTDPVLPLFQAGWLALSNRLPQAITLVQKTNFANPALQSVALSQLAVWQLLSGDRSGATRSATAAGHIDPRPASVAGIALLLIHGNIPPDTWRAQVNAAALSAPVKETLLEYGFFLNAHYPEAAQLWQEALTRSGNTDLRARAMLAASLDRAGRAADAQKILVQPFVPELGDLYAAVSFDQMHRLLRISVR